MSLLNLIQNETNSSFAKRGAKEYHGPCPFCANTEHGKRPFVIFPEVDNERYWCRACEKKGDSIQFVRDYKHFSYRQALEFLGLESNSRFNNNNNNNHNVNNNHNNHNNKSATPLTSPSEQWIEAANAFLDACNQHMTRNTNPKVRTYLHNRGLNDETIARWELGYNPTDHYVERESWGLEPAFRENGQPKGLWLPRGVVIPWYIDGSLWSVRVLRPTGSLKYYFIPGGTANGLYGADSLSPGQTAIIVEGEIDALTIAQAASDIVTPVATGSTNAARRPKWLARLSTCKDVLVAYDTDNAGEHASKYWLDALPNARRWRPFWSDANDMAQQGVNVRRWVQQSFPRPKLPRTTIMFEQLEQMIKQRVDGQSLTNEQIEAFSWYAGELGVLDDPLFQENPQGALEVVWRKSKEKS